MVSCESFCTILAPTHHCLGCQSYVALNAQIILGAFLTFSTMRGTTINQAHPVIHAGDYLLFSVRIPWIHATENVHNLFSTILPPPKIPHTHNCSMTSRILFFQLGSVPAPYNSTARTIVKTTTAGIQIVGIIIRVLHLTTQ